MLYGNQRLMNCGLLRAIHAHNLTSVCGQPQARKTKSPALERAGLMSAYENDYLAGVFAVESVAAAAGLDADLLWCLLLW